MDGCLDREKANIPAHGFHLHARKSKCTVSLHTDDPFTFFLTLLLSSRSYCKSKAYAHCSKCTSIQSAQSTNIISIWSNLYFLEA